MRTLVTGAAGNLARQLIQELHKRGDEITGIDLKETAIPGVRTEIVDITDVDGMRAIVRQVEPERIYHMASLLSSTSAANPDLAWRINANASRDLLAICAEEGGAAGGARFFYPSTGATYGGNLPDPLPEDFPQWPISIYGATKVAIERLGTYYSAAFDLDFRCLRLPLVLSPSAPAGAVSAYASHAFLAAHEPAEFVFPVEPETAISSIYVKDVLTGIITLMEAEPGRLSRRVYNIHSISPTAQQIAQSIHLRVPDFAYSFSPDASVMGVLGPLPAVHEDHSARHDWGWNPMFDLEAIADDLLSGGRHSSTAAMVQ